MATFLLVLCLVIAGFLVRLNFFLIFPPLIVAYLIAKFTNFNKVSDRECMAIIVAVLLAIAVMAFVRQQI